MPRFWSCGAYSFIRFAMHARKSGLIDQGKAIK